MAVPKPLFLGLTHEKNIVVFDLFFLYDFRGLSGLESSITRIEVSNFRSSISSINFEMLSASRYVGRMMPISDVKVAVAD